MINIKKNLDTTISDIEVGENGETNTETYREFFVNSLTKFYGEGNYNKDLDNMSNKELNDLLSHLDRLWSQK